MSEADLYRWVLWAVFALALLTVGALSVMSAPYGRHARQGWGPSLPARWAWVLMESPSSLGFLVLFFFGTHAASVVPLLFLVLWQSHYVHRTFIYPARLPQGTKPMPFLVVSMGFSFNILNMYLNSRWISHWGDYATAWLWDPRFVVGVLLFGLGYFINRRADAILLLLRRRGEGYQIPQGFLYRFVSCPNYLGEIVLWCGWAVATWSWAGLAFAVYTMANLAPRALQHHRWYQRTFPSYPSERRALVPFIL